MSTTPLPSPNEIVEQHRALLQLIVEALRAGATHAQEYAIWQNEPIDRALAPAHVRKGARRLLIERGQTVANEEEADAINGNTGPNFEPEFLSNLGLAVNASGVRIRILKSDRGNLPVPGPSRLRQQFYAQQQFLPFLDTVPEAKEEPALPPTANLVLHWATDITYELDRVYLACPKAGGLTRDSVEAYWDVLIWRRQILAISNSQVEADAVDLDIYIDDTDEETGTNE